MEMYHWELVEHQPVATAESLPSSMGLEAPGHYADETRDAPVVLWVTAPERLGTPWFRNESDTDARIAIGG